MQIKHPAIQSPVFELSKTIEFDLHVRDECWPIRIEVFLNTETAGRFRCCVWQAEYFRIQSTFPSGERGPEHPPSDELIWVRFAGPKMREYNDIKAQSADAALSIVLKDFGAFLEHTTLKPARI